MPIMVLMGNQILKCITEMKIVFLIVFFAISFYSHSQVTPKGDPFITNYSKKEYGGGTQCWGSDVIDNGHILIANDQGLLEYNGSNWQKYTLPNRTIARSILANKDRIYIGGQDEIGYFSPNDLGKLTFQSIRHLIPEIHLPLQDVWQIVSHKKMIYFRSVNRIYIFDQIANQFTVVDPKNPIISLLSIDDKIYYNDLYKGLISIQDTSHTYPGSELLNYVPIINAFPSLADTIFITERFGIFKREGETMIPANEKTHKNLINKGVFCAIRLDKERIAIGTQFGGIIIINNQGKTLNVIDRTSGLSNNNVHTITQDSLGNIWTGTSNGINKIELDNPLKILKPDGNTKGSFYSIMEHEGKLYFGSNNALYETDLNIEDDPYQIRTYKTVKYSEGQVWGLNIIDGDLLMGHNNGAYQIKNGVAELFSKEPGAWKFIKARNDKEIYVGTYQGVHIYKKREGKWKFFKKLEGFVESSRILISVKPNEVWVSHPYRGIFRIEHNKDYFVTKVTEYGDQNGLPSSLGNYIFEIENTPYVTAQKGIYRFDRTQDQFILDENLNQIIDSTKNVRRLSVDKNKNLWYIAEHEVGRLTYKNGAYSKTLFPSLEKQFVGGFETMYFPNAVDALICSDEKVLSLDATHIKNNTLPSTQITSCILAINPDSLLYGGYSIKDSIMEYCQSDQQIPQLNYQQNALKFEFSSPNHDINTKYSFALKDNNSPSTRIKWSSWTNSTNKEYNNLNYGYYTFQVKSMLSDGSISTPASYKFKINAPWYFSDLAKSVYFLLMLSSIGALFFIPRKKYEKEKIKLTTAIEESDAKLEQIQTEKLKAEIDYKNSELASSTMHLVQKNETINKLRTEITNVSKKIKDPDAKKEIRKIISLLSDDERLENDWDNFSYHFDQVHTDFIKRISTEYPQLTPKDKKLCAYLRMNLSTKEIAPLLNISVRGVEISRYRLRKKIELNSDVNLNEFMMSF